MKAQVDTKSALEKCAEASDKLNTMIDEIIKLRGYAGTTGALHSFMNGLMAACIIHFEQQGGIIVDNNLKCIENMLIHIRKK